MDGDVSEVGGQLPIHFLPLSIAGRVGFSLAPGRRGRGSDGRYWTRDLDEDLDRLSRVARVDGLVNLLDPSELRALRIPRLTAAASERGLRVIDAPLERPPGPRVLARLTEIIAELQAETEQGRTWAVISGDGLARAPLVAACFMVGQRSSAAQAMEVVRRLGGPSCLSEPTFRDVVARFEAHIRDRKREGESEEAADRPERTAPQTAGAQRVAEVYGRPRPPETPRERGMQAAPRGAAWTPTESAIVGSVLGAALGDALSEAGPFPEPSDPSVSASTVRLSARSQLAVCALETLIEARPRRLEMESTLARLAEHIGRWALRPRGGHRKPESACLDVGKRLAEGVPWSEATRNANAGASGLARAPAFGLAFFDDLRRAEHWGGAQSRVTHAGSGAVAAAAALTVGVAAQVAGRSLTESLSEMVAAACRQNPGSAVRLARALEKADLGVPVDRGVATSDEPQATEVVAGAMFVLRRHPDDFEMALREAMKVPGAANAVATCVGALLGSRLGAGALPPAWLRALELRTELEGLALALAASR